MKSLTPLTIFLRSASSPSPPSPHFLSSHVVLFYSTTTEELQRKRSTSSHSFSSSSLSSQSDDSSRNVKVSVWWDFENCSIPNGADASKVAKNITSAVRANGIKGPVSITAFGDFIQLSRVTQETLSITGVSLNHVPSGGKNTADRSLLADLVFWVSQNPPPAHLFLISGDTDFANILHRLRMNNYNILLASRHATPGVLCSAASIWWHWKELLKGENFSGKHFNEPPDGPWESWYGHNRGPLEDPFHDMGQHTRVEAEEFPDAVTVSKPCGVPKAVVNRISQVLYSYPKGVYISELRSELERSGVPMDKGFFGYKKFSHLLKSLPTVLKIQCAADGQIFVHGIQPRIAEPVAQPKVAGPFQQPKVTEQRDQPKVAGQLDQPKVAQPVDQPKAAGPLDLPKLAKPVDSKLRPSGDLEANNGDKNKTVTAELSGRKDFVNMDLNKKSSLPAYCPPKTDTPPTGPKENLHLTEGHLSPMEQNDFIPEVGFFQRAWRAVFGHNGDASNKKSDNSPEFCSTSADSFERREPEEKSVCSSVSSSNLNESVLEEKTRINFEEEEKSSPGVGMFSKIVRWCRSSEASTNPDNTSGHFGEEVNQMNKSDNNELFLKVAFWEDMLAFLDTAKGAALISQSKTREQMAQQLQREGPPDLNSLAIGDLSHLVDILISEKKWVDESISKTFPFKLIHPTRILSSSSSPQSSKELSSIFSGKLSQSNLRRPPGIERQNGKDYRYGAFLNETNKKPSGKSKSEILADCHKLVAEMFKEHPEGFNMSILRNAFRERYGYDLDHQKLGYSKQAALLQTIPGVVLSFSFVLPPEKAPNIVTLYSEQNDSTVNTSNSDSELSDSTRKHNNHDSTWKEPSPISETKSKINCLRSGTTRESNKGFEHVYLDENSYLSDELSDGSNGKRPTRINDGNSSLLHLLDSFYGPNGKPIKDQLDNKNEVDCSRIDLKLSSEIEVDRSTLFQNSELKKHRQTYSFISDTVTDAEDMEKSVKGLFDTLKKSSDPKLQSQET